MASLPFYLLQHQVATPVAVQGCPLLPFVEPLPTLPLATLHPYNPASRRLRFRHELIGLIIIEITKYALLKQMYCGLSMKRSIRLRFVIL
jgi:hypothetical protein